MRLRTMQILAFSLLLYLNYTIAINAYEQKPIMEEFLSLIYCKSTFN